MECRFHAGWDQTLIFLIFDDFISGYDDTYKFGKKTIYLVSFFEGLQRIILFTEDPRVFKVTYESEKAELAETKKLCWLYKMLGFLLSTIMQSRSSLYWHYKVSCIRIWIHLSVSS